MAFLRVLRDKRGYETTYLVHWFREGSRQRSKILYVFRTPPGVRVGRNPLDPAIVREIESQHPGIEFDWRSLQEHRQVIDHAAEPRRPRAGRNAGRGEPAEGGRRRRESRQERPEEKAAAPPEVAAPAPDAGSPPAAAPARPSVPAAIDGETREERLAFLARWYPELRDRIPHRTQDPIRREALRALVERLNAAGWQTEEEIAAGLESAAEALHRLSRVFSKRRRRARRPRPPEAGTPPAHDPA